MATEELQIVREIERKRMTGISRVQSWRLERMEKFPKRIAIGDNSVGWLRHEIQDWIRDCASRRAVNTCTGK